MLFLLRKCNYLIQEKASLVFVSCIKRVDKKLGLVPGELLALWKVLEGPEKISAVAQVPAHPVLLSPFLDMFFI